MSPAQAFVHEDEPLEQQQTGHEQTDLSVPQTSDPTTEQIAALAYALWQERGCPDGSPEVDWFQAEEQLSNS